MKRHPRDTGTWGVPDDSGAVEAKPNSAEPSVTGHPGPNQSYWGAPPQDHLLTAGRIRLPSERDYHLLRALLRRIQVLLVDGF